MRNVVCMKWGTAYSPEYVNILAASVARNLAGEYRFVCFTDDANGLNPSIEALPLPETSNLEKRSEGCWQKLTLFQEKLFDLEGTALFLDLDIVIADSLDPFFEVPGNFRIIEDWGKLGSKIGNSSVFRFEVGSRPDVLEYFLANREEVYATTKNEQEYLSRAIDKKEPIQFWDPNWCLSFKKHFMRPFPLGYFCEPKKRPGTKIIVFHGNPKPYCVRDGWRNQTGLKAVRKTPWMADLWKE